MTDPHADDQPLRLVFAGTPEFAVPCLAACQAVAGMQVVAVYTQPDRPAGRGHKLGVSPVKQAALAAGIAVEQPASLKSPTARERLASYRADLLVVVAYGLILPRAVLAMPTHGCWNVHASVLPRWRGAAPIQRAIQAGDAGTGVSLMQMDAGLDTGPVLLERRTAIAPTDTGGSLHDRLAVLGAQVLDEGLARLRDGTLPAPQPQPETGASYAHKLDKALAALDFTQSAAALERQVRAFNPWPVATASLHGETVRVWAASVVAKDRDAAPGTVLDERAQGIVIACGEDALSITRLQRAGGKCITAADYVNARRDRPARA